MESASLSSATGGPLGDALVVADADGQHETVLAKREGARHIHWPRWSGDSKYIYFNHGPQNFNIEPTGVFRIAATGGPIEPVIATARRAAFPFSNSDGTALVYAANPDTVDLNLWWRDLATGRDTRLTSGVGEYTHPVLSSDGRLLIGTVLDSRQSLVRVAVESRQTLATGAGDRWPLGRFRSLVVAGWRTARLQLVANRQQKPVGRARRRRRCRRRSPLAKRSMNGRPFRPTGAKSRSFPIVVDAGVSG